MIDRELFVKVFDLMPLEDCGDCGLKTCREFAEKVIVGEKSVFECTKIKDDKAQEVSLLLDEYLR
jgi:ArsR family metal-binding transcriptional regulator